MILTELIIDGFKSYGERTVIDGWDPSFNAIYGNNGHGKSNVLDAICFVLGMTRTGLMRGKQITDLIYNKGQTGVTKATVTIKFDNRDKSRSPPAYTHLDEIAVMRQIAINNKPKYMIDGRTCSQGDVHSLFQQAGLDVNNPNFLIQQGEVTKVLNSTPKDILKKIEQALGTVGYEKEKGAAITALGRKEKKVRELEDMLANEIDPKMRKLREQKSRFLEFQKTQNDLERLSRLVIAYDYVQCRDKLQKSAEDLKRKQERVEELKLDEAETEAQIQCLEEDKNKIEVERENELRKGGTVNELEEEIKAHSDQIARLSTNIECEEDTMEDESAKKSSTEKTVRMLESQLEEKQEKYERLAERHASAKNVLQRQSKEVEDQEELLQSLQTGVASKEGQRSGYQGQLHEAQKRRVDAETEEKQKMRQISHLEKQIKDDEPKARSAEQQNAKLLQKLEEEKSQVKQLKEHLSRIGIDAERESNMQQEESILQDEIRGLQQKANDSRRKITRMDFEYQDPTPNFDRSRVKGQLAELFTVKDSFLDSVKDPKKDPYTPLEVSAGTHLENVIVDNTDTSRELINHGKLKRRFNFIPLKGIKEYEPCPAKISAAQRLAPGKVNLALSLIEYHDDVRKAMEFVFGSTLVCEDGDAAKKVTFEPSIRMRSVTLAGDVYEPGGTLTGGSAAKGSGVLKALQELNRILVDLREKEKSLSDLQATMARDRESLQAARKFRQELDLKTLQVELIQKQIDGNSSSVTIQRLEEAKRNLLNLKEEAKAAKATRDEASRDIERITRDMADFHNNKDGKLAEEQSLLDKLRKALSEGDKAIKPLERELREAKVDLEQCRAELATAQEQLADFLTSVRDHERKIADLRTERTAAEKLYNAANERLAGEKARLTRFDAELRDLGEAIDAKKAKIGNGRLERQELIHEIKAFDDNRRAADQKIRALEAEYDWVAEESGRFGRPDTPYDFRGQDIGARKAERKRLQEQFTGLKSQINPKVMATIDATEKREAAVKKRLDIVKRDKDKIVKTVEKLDRYKMQALEEAWHQVNGHFGRFFGELYRGEFARLRPLEGRPITDGLEIQVRLGGIWKESLSELSGGQKSLAALALIFAILQFKPAPLYILDEIDAAMDASNTQYIGQFIQKAFPKKAQFVIVSLKNELFSNANRIYKATLVNRVSQVTKEK